MTPAPDFTCIRDLIDCWPVRDDLAADLRAAGHDVTVDRIHKWARNGVPNRFQHAMVEAAQARGFPITAEIMVRMHHRPVNRDAAA